MTGFDVGLLGATLVVAAALQGLSGLGFSLLAAPVLTQLFPGSGSIGLVNLLALGQNLWQVARERAPVAWPALRTLALPLGVGVGTGLVVSLFAAESVRPLVVAASSLATVAALAAWRPRPGKISAWAAGLWSGSINSYAGVGGPPLAVYLLQRGNLDHGQFVRTLQVAFAVMNAVTIPVLGLPTLPWWTLPVAFAAVAAGATLGMLARRSVPARAARNATVVVVLAVSVTALVRAVTLL